MESPLKIMKNAFHFTSKALFVLKIFKFFVLTFWSCIKTTQLNLKFNDVTPWLANNCNTYIAQYLET